MMNFKFLLIYVYECQLFIIKCLKAKNNNNNNNNVFVYLKFAETVGLKCSHH